MAGILAAQAGTINSAASGNGEEGATLVEGIVLSNTTDEAVILNCHVVRMDTIDGVGGDQSTLGVSGGGGGQPYTGDADLRQVGEAGITTLRQRRRD